VERLGGSIGTGSGEDISLNPINNKQI